MGDTDMDTRVRTAAAVAVTLLLGLACTGRSFGAPTPAPSPQSPAPAPSRPHWAVDPCALLGSNDLTDAVGAVNPHPTRPTPDQCLWSVAQNQHTPGGVRQVLLTVDAADEAKNGCKGLNCVALIRSITGYIPGLDRFNNTVDTLGGDATLISGLGNRAAWGHGILAVLENNTIFKLQLSGTQSDMLDASELLAHKVISNMGPH
jgi:hypothetical protein